MPSPELDERPRCLACHKPLLRTPPKDKFVGWRCARGGSSWAGPSELAQGRDAPASGSDRLRSSYNNSPHPAHDPPTDDIKASSHPTGNGKPNGHAILVEWKPERGLYRIPGAAESEPAHPWWHLDSCLFRHFNVEWIRRGPRE